MADKATLPVSRLPVLKSRKCPVKSKSSSTVALQNIQPATVVSLPGSGGSGHTSSEVVLPRTPLKPILRNVPVPDSQNSVKSVRFGSTTDLLRGKENPPPTFILDADDIDSAHCSTSQSQKIKNAAPARLGISQRVDTRTDVPSPGFRSNPSSLQSILNCKGIASPAFNRQSRASFLVGKKLTAPDKNAKIDLCPSLPSTLSSGKQFCLNDRRASFLSNKSLAPGIRTGTPTKRFTLSGSASTSKVAVSLTVPKQARQAMTVSKFDRRQSFLAGKRLTPTNSVMGSGTRPLFVLPQTNSTKCISTTGAGIQQIETAVRASCKRSGGDSHRQRGQIHKLKNTLRKPPLPPSLAKRGRSSEIHAQFQYDSNSAALQTNETFTVAAHATPLGDKTNYSSSQLLQKPVSQILQKPVTPPLSGSKCQPNRPHPPTLTPTPAHRRPRIPDLSNTPTVFKRPALPKLRHCRVSRDSSDSSRTSCEQTQDENQNRKPPQPERFDGTCNTTHDMSLTLLEPPAAEETSTALSPVIVIMSPTGSPGVFRSLKTSAPMTPTQIRSRSFRTPKHSSPKRCIAASRIAKCDAPISLDISGLSISPVCDEQKRSRKIAALSSSESPLLLSRVPSYTAIELNLSSSFSQLNSEISTLLSTRSEESLLCASQHDRCPNPIASVFSSNDQHFVPISPFNRSSSADLVMFS